MTENYKETFLSAASTIKYDINQINTTVSNIISSVSEISGLVRPNAFVYRGTKSSFKTLLDMIKTSNGAEPQGVEQGDVYTVTDMYDTMYILTYTADEGWEWKPFCGDLLKKVAEVMSSFEGLSGLFDKVDELSGKVAENTDDISRLSRDVANNTNSIVNLRGDVDENTRVIGDIDTRLSQNGEIGKIIAWVEQAYNKKTDLSDSIKRVMDAITNQQ